MTQEDKDLLLCDLSSRLPYHPIVYGKTGYTMNEGHLTIVTSSGCTIMTFGGSTIHYFFDEVKPYLRPMSSMTDEETKEYKHFIAFSGSPNGAVNFVDWLNKYHFDYRGLIKKGLALEAPEGMYK